MRRPNSTDLQQLAERVGWFKLCDSEAEDYASLAGSVLSLLDEVDRAGLEQYWTVEQVEPRSRTVVRNPGRRPRAGEDPFNAVVRWCDVRDDSATGVLEGLRLAVKDSVAVAGIPMTLGSNVLRGYIPTVDSVVAERLLQCGARVVATTNMDNFAFSGGGDTSAYGDVLNPFDETRSAGGSSGGSAAALYYEEAIDASIGCDQGGSIRLPAAWCGVIGLKPTHSLVPYTGIAGIDATFDHAGPMARSADKLARVLQAIAGPHPSDPRQKGIRYDESALVGVAANREKGFDGVRIGLIAEAFPEDHGRKATSEAIRKVADKMADGGALVEEVSVPAHLEAGGIAFAGFMEGMAALLRGGGNGYHFEGRYAPELALALAQGLRTSGEELPPQIKLVCLLGEYLASNYGSAVYAAAQNQRPYLRKAYDEQLKTYDVLLLPTAPYPAYAHDQDLSVPEKVMRGWEPLGNCAPFDMTGHPAISLPAASVDGLPVGAMLVGPHFEDARLVDFAARYECAFGWEPQTPTFLQSRPDSPVPLI